MRALVIALHDVAPSTIGATCRWRTIVAGLTGGPVSLLVVPRYQGRDSWRSGPAPRALRASAEAGDEVVLHGYTHLSVAGRDGRELVDRPPRAIAALLREGLAELDLAGVPADGFIAPSYAHPAATDDACRAAGLGWWATRAALVGRRGEVVRLPSVGLGASTATRRLLSPAATRSAVRLLAPVRALRVDLHPADLGHARLERAGRDLLAMLLDQGRVPMTHADLLPGGASPPLPVRPGRGATTPAAAA